MFGEVKPKECQVDARALGVRGFSVQPPATITKWCNQGHLQVSEPPIYQKWEI